MLKIKPVIITTAIISLALLGGSKIYTQYNSASSSKPTATLEKLKVNSLGFAGGIGTFKKLDSSLDQSKLPNEFPVFRVEKPDVSTEKIKAKAEKFNVKGKIVEDDKSIYVKGDNADFIVDKSTGSEKLLSKQLRGDIPEVPIKNILPDAEYIQKAEQYLKDNDLAKDDMVCKGVNKGYRIVSIDSKGNETPNISRIEVMFTKKPSNGVAFNGVGPKISVWFGEDGQILGYGSLWRDFKPYKNYPLMSVDESIANIKNGKALIDNGDIPDAEGTITSAEFVIWSDPNGMSQEYGIPHYIFKGKTKEGKDFTIVTRAVSDKYLEESEQ